MKSPRTIAAAGLMVVFALGACGKPANVGQKDVPNGGPRATVAKTHRLDEFRISGSLTADEVMAQFGPPAREVGSGVTWYVYELDDGKEVWLRFRQGKDVSHSLLDADLYERHGETLEKVRRLYGDSAMEL